VSEGSQVRCAGVALLAGLLTASAAAAFEGRYRVHGTGLAGDYTGSALVDRSGDVYRIALKTTGPSRERRAEVEGVRSGLELSFDLPGRLVARVRMSADRSVLRVGYWDGSGDLVRREVWAPSGEVRIPVVVAALSGGPGFSGVDADRAAAARDTILAHLASTYGRLAAFEAAGEVVVLDGPAADRDGDGRLSRAEGDAIRADLERRGAKRPGRVVLVLTAAPFIGRGCRGWTLGDAPPTPRTLTDANDNFSLVGVDYLDPDAHHTVPHEVGHQLGLDDLRPANRGLLAAPSRRDHLMESGGRGVHLDRRVLDVLRPRVLDPDHGLRGRRAASAHLLAGPDEGDDEPAGLGAVPPG